MNDPSPENITGQKVYQHTFKHEVRWDYLLGLLLLAYVLFRFVTRSSSIDDEESEPEGATIEISDEGVSTSGLSG